MKWCFKNSSNVLLKLFNCIFIIVLLCALTHHHSLASALGVPQKTSFHFKLSKIANGSNFGNLSGSKGVNKPDNYPASAVDLVFKPTPSLEIHLKKSIAEKQRDQPPLRKAVWCYCNMAECVRTGYMCQSSEEGACFSKRAVIQDPLTFGGAASNHLHHLAIDTLTRGCVESLTQEERIKCRRKLDHSVGTAEKLEVDGAKSDQASRGDMLCCSQNICNYELKKPIIVREIGSADSSVSFRASWLKGTTIGVSVGGVIVLVLLIAFAGKMLSTEPKGRNSSFLPDPSGDLYIKVPYRIERTGHPGNVDVPGGCSVLCVKALQKRQDVADYCRFHPLSSANSNRHSFSCPSSLSSCSTLTPTSSSREQTENEELQPLTGFPRAVPLMGQEGRNIGQPNMKEGSKTYLANRNEREILIRPSPPNNPRVFY